MKYSSKTAKGFFVFSPYHKNGAEQCLRAWGHVSRYLRGYLEEGVKEEARDADEKQEVVEHRDGVGIHFEVCNLEKRNNDVMMIFGETLINAHRLK